MIRPLAEVRRGDVASVGGKAAPLGELLAAGFNVPAGFVVTAEAFRRALADGGPDGLRLSDELRAGLRAASVELGAVPLAVRSSATSEDGGRTSFAGQYASVIGVRGEEALADAVLAVWRSFFSANAVAARAAAGVTDDAMAVLVQPVIEAECAGVAFSVDPVKHRPDLVVIDAVWGLGLGAVDGSVASDTYWMRRDLGGPLERSLVEKAERYVLDATGGVRREPVPEDRRRVPCLGEGGWRGAVADLAMAAEWALGAPQDVEWAIADNRLWLLQSRPITGLPDEMRVVGSFPLSAEDAARVGRSFWRAERTSLGRVCRPLEHDLVSAADRTQQVTGLWNGDRRTWRYEQINGRGYFTPVDLGALGGHKRIAESAAADLGERVREAGVTPWQHYAPEVVKATERLRGFDAAAADGPKLADHLEDALAAHHRHWAVHWQMVGLYGKAFEPYKKAVEKLSGLSGEAAEDLGARLLEGEETALTRLIDGLHELGALAGRDEALAAVLRDPPDDPLGQLSEMPGGEELRRRLEAFLAEFGERVGVGFGSAATYETRSWREDPRPALALAAAYLDPAVEPPSARRERARAERDAEVERLCAACADADAVAELRRWLPYARRVATDLEEHNHYIDQMTFGQLRHALGAAGRWLTERGAASCADDLFWLRIDEILGALRSAQPPSLDARLAERRAQAAAWAELTPPPIMGPPPAALDPRREYKEELTAPVAEDARQLKGQAASRGRHRGRARVVAMTEVLPAVSPGDVLVAENAGPQWTPLFPILGAIVLDQGVLTQHAGTTAREYGIPAVMRTNVATRRIPDGAWVIVDGDAGTVDVEG